jgi:hypothetical protein
VSKKDYEENFCTFILSHGRPNTVKTYDTLRNHGYTGKIFIICDNEDSTIDEYRENYGDQVIMFDKKAIADRIDNADNTHSRKGVTYARVASYDIARGLGYKYFWQLDDDYLSFYHVFNGKKETRNTKLTKLDAALKIMLAYYISAPIDTLCMSQGGDHIGGSSSGMLKNIGIKRKAMNSFIMSTDREIGFFGRINDDVSTIVRLGSVGTLFFTHSMLKLNQPQTQAMAGGMSDVFKDGGTYLKSFYSVLYSPSSVQISTLGRGSGMRIHHRVNWNKAVPKILREKHSA